MKSNKGAFAVPILIILVGVGWLLTAQGYGPGINWVWTLGLAAVGIVTLVLSGIDKVSVVIGPFFLVASLLSVLRQTNNLDLDTEVPILVIVVGVLLALARLAAIPAPEWIIPNGKPPEKKP
jgi:hypothetical protein